MVYVRKNLLDHEAVVLLQSKVTTKMNDKIISNNEGEAQPQQNNQLQNINGSNVKQKPRALLLCQPNSHPFQVIFFKLFVLCEIMLDDRLIYKPSKCFAYNFVIFSLLLVCCLKGMKNRGRFSLTN